MYLNCVDKSLALYYYMFVNAVNLGQFQQMSRLIHDCTANMYAVTKLLFPTSYNYGLAQLN